MKAVCLLAWRLLSSLALLLALAPSSQGSISQVTAAPPSQTVVPPLATQPVLLTDPLPDPHLPGVVWFSPTGHTLRGSFLQYWNEHGGLAQFGYPLTEEFFEEVGPEHKQYQVQYFERNRFELHPENAGTPYEVLLGSLGRDFHSPDPPAAAIPGTSYFPQTGHNLGGVFLAYWQSHGGVGIHGYPISEQIREVNQVDHKEYTVQYFERSRFEYHPENAGSEYEVLLGLLGRQLSEQKGYPYGWYPLYGHAPDWSWVAGYYKSDHRKLPHTDCATIHYEHPNSKELIGPGEILAYVPGLLPGPGRYDRQPSPLGQSSDERFTATPFPQHFLVVFGALDDPRDLDNSQRQPSCLEPKYRVVSVQFNP